MRVQYGNPKAHPVYRLLGGRCFKHYMYFVYEFDLIPRKEELAPLQVRYAGLPTAS